MFLLLHLACTGGGDLPLPPGTTTDTTTEPVVTCPAGQTVVVQVTGSAGADPGTLVGVLDSASWRLGDAEPLSVPMMRDGEIFTVCLTGEPLALRAYNLAFIGAWTDLDGDGRLDAGSEPVCDRTRSGTLGEELYFQAGVWRTGLRGTVGEPLSPAAALDGDSCSL